MTREREKLIRDHWNMARGWPFRGEVMRVAICRPPPLVKRTQEVPSREELETLDFKRKYGTFNGRRAIRVTCEGVVLETVVE